MPSNQHGPYYPRTPNKPNEAVDSPNKKFDNMQAPELWRPTYSRSFRRDQSHSSSSLLPINNITIRPSNSPMNLKVSIIMPTFRRAHAIQHAVNSILNQTYRNWQLIIVDNEFGHPPYQFDDKRIECYNHSDTPSAAFARNSGTSYIQGDLVCFFDDDDVMNPRYLERMASPFQDDRVYMTHCQVKFEDTGNVMTGNMNAGNCTPSVMVRKDLITPTWSSDNFGHDQLYWGAIIDSRPRHLSIYDVDEVLVYCSTSPKGGMREGHL